MLTIQQAEQFQTALLEQNALLLTPNHQLAVALHETLGTLLRESGSPAVCKSPAILAIDVWVRNSWEGVSASAGHDRAHWQVLTSGQEQLIWHGIISGSRDTTTLLNPGDCVKAASQAATLMKQHYLTRGAIEAWLRDNWPTPEERLDLTDFLAWYKQYEALKQEKELLSLSELVEITGELVRDGRVTVPELILTYGFTEPPPLYQALLDDLTARSSCQPLLPEKLTPELSIRQCHNPLNEIQAAAQWADSILQSTPKAKIGILSPDAATRHEQTVRVFSCYDNLKPTADHAREAINQQLFINSTVSLLKLNRPVLDTLEICRLLRSPVIAGSDTETSARAALEFRLRRYGEHDLSVADLRFTANQEERSHHCPDLGLRLQNFAEIARPLLNRNLSPAHCLDVFNRQLHSLGWPGDRTLNTAERKALELWQKLQDQFLAVSAFRASMTLSEATDCLEELAGRHHFNPPQVTDSVCLLSAEEAEHLQFTHLWIMGVNEHLWPRDSHPNPLLPFSLQREHGLPGTDRNRQYQMYESLLATLGNNAYSQVVMSYACLQDELDARPSPALMQFSARHEPVSENSDRQFSPVISELRGSADLETSLQPAVLPLNSSEQPRGGKSLLQNQSQCPFLSYAVHRLDAAELVTPTYGLNPMVLGNLLHAVLENVWQELRTSQALLSLSQEDLVDLAKRSSRQAVEQLARHHPQLMQPRFRELENQRLTELVVNWLATEQERDFGEVAALEEQFVWHYKSLSLSLKADRIDRNRQHKLEVIDYKSGQPFTIRWDEERPRQPQLMLYLLAVEEQYGSDTVSALLHAYVSAGNFSFQYINEGQTGTIPASARPGREYDWPEIRQLWQRALEALADEFIDGLHSVSPANISYCHTCYVKPLCRIDLNPAAQLESVDINDHGNLS